MKTLSINQAQTWCAERGLGLDGFGNPYFQRGGMRGLELKIPEKPSAFVPLILALLDATVDETDLPSGAEHLMWLRDWSIWGNLSTSVGLELFNHLRFGYGLIDTADETPAILFAESEISSLISFSLVPLVFGWDCYILPASAKHFAFISHDEWIGVSSVDEATETKMLSRLSHWGPRPQPAP